MAERLIEGVNGKVIADRGYAEAEFVRKTEGYIRPRGKAGKEFTKRPIFAKMGNRKIYSAVEDENKF